MRWVSAFMGIVSWSPTIVTDQLPPTSTLSSSALASSTPLKACSRYPSALVRRSRFCMDSIGWCFLHHQFITLAPAFIMPYWPTKVAEQLLPCLYKLLQQMEIISCVFPCYLTYRAPQCRPRARSCLGFRPQRHQSSSCNIFHKAQAVVFVMSLTFTFQAPYFFAHLWSNYSVLLQTLHF